MQVYLTVNIRGAFAIGMGVPFLNFFMPKVVSNQSHGKSKCTT